jgi:hypothetical protein
VTLDQLLSFQPLPHPVPLEVRAARRGQPPSPNAPPPVPPALRSRSGAAPTAACATCLGVALPAPCPPTRSRAAATSRAPAGGGGGFGGALGIGGAVLTARAALHHADAERLWQHEGPALRHCESSCAARQGRIHPCVAARCRQPHTHGSFTGTVRHPVRSRDPGGAPAAPPCDLWHPLPPWSSQPRTVQALPASCSLACAVFCGKQPLRLTVLQALFVPRTAPCCWRPPHRLPCHTHTLSTTHVQIDPCTRVCALRLLCCATRSSQEHGPCTGPPRATTRSRNPFPYPDSCNHLCVCKQVCHACQLRMAAVRRPAMRSRGGPSSGPERE